MLEDKDLTVRDLVTSLGPYASVIMNHFSAEENRTDGDVFWPLISYATFLANDKAKTIGFEKRGLQRLDALYMMEHTFGKGIFEEELSKLIVVIHHLADVAPQKYQETLQYFFYCTSGSEANREEKIRLGWEDIHNLETYDETLRIRTTAFINQIVNGVYPVGTWPHNWKTQSDTMLKEALNDYEPGSVFPYLQELRTQLPE